MNRSTQIEYSPYAPIRLQHELWWKYAVDIARRGLVVADGRLVEGLPDLVMNELVMPMINEGAKNLKKEIPDPDLLGNLIGDFAAQMMEQRHWVPLIAQYSLCGRQIFDLADNLVEMLENTDFGDCTLGDWKSPYDALFVRFGKRDKIRLPYGDSFEYLDGAFVAITPWDVAGSTRRIKIGFATVKDDGRGVMMPGYFVDITPDEQQLPVREAVNFALARRIEEFNDDPDDDESTRALNAHRRQRVRDAEAILRQALPLIVNALFYIETAGHRDKLAPGRGTPTELTDQWADASPRKREKLRSRLLSSGYSTVYLMGNEYDESAGPYPQAGSKRTHWRRGHWRRQHHGEGNLLVKRIWVKPQMIGVGRPIDDMPGHIYKV